MAYANNVFAVLRIAWAFWFWGAYSQGMTMKLCYPITSEIFTFVHEFNATVAGMIKTECRLNVLQYRILSALKQENERKLNDLIGQLRTSPSRFSQVLKLLIDKKWVVQRTDHGPAKYLSITKQGITKLNDADLVLREACDEVFSPLGAEYNKAIRQGSLLTNQRHGIVRIEGGIFFEEYACFEAFLHAEAIITESTQYFGIEESDFRILFYVYEYGPHTKSEISAGLMIAPASFTDRCGFLVSHNYLSTSLMSCDRRRHVVALTKEGRVFTEKVASYVDLRAYRDLRPFTDEECVTYQNMAAIFVKHRESQGGRSAPKRLDPLRTH